MIIPVTLSSNLISHGKWKQVVLVNTQQRYSAAKDRPRRCQCVDSLHLKLYLPWGRLSKVEILICHKTKLSSRFTRLTTKSPIRDAASKSMNAGQHIRDKIQGFYVTAHFSSFAKCWSHLSCHASFPVLSGLIYFADMLTPYTVKQNLLAAPFSASTNTQLLVCRSNAEQKMIFTCVITITQLQNICD